MDNKKYFEILKNCMPDINKFLPNGILLLWDNDENHKPEMSFYYYIENKIQLFECLAYNPYLNPIENVKVNIK